jgi:hypothetical protein
MNYSVRIIIDIYKQIALIILFVVVSYVEFSRSNGLVYSQNIVRLNDKKIKIIGIKLAPM